MPRAPYELLVQRNTLPTQGAIFGVVGRKVAAHEAEDRLAVLYLHRGASPEAADSHDLSAKLLDQLDEQIQGGAARHEVLDQQDAGAGPDQPLELDRQGDAALAASSATRGRLRRRARRPRETPLAP